MCALIAFALVGGNAQASITAVLSGTLPDFDLQPVSVTRLVGKKVIFRATASGPSEYGPVTFQWYFNEEPIPGAAARRSTYGFIATLASAGTYRVRATNELGSSDSEPATLTVHQRPKLTAQPAAVTTLDAGQPLTLSAAATGTPAPAFQWFRNGVEIPDATSSTYQIDAVEAFDTAAYKVRVSNAAGSVFSRPASVVVRSAPVIVDSPADTDAYVGTPLRLSVTAYGFPRRSYQWRFNGEPIRGARSPVFVLKPTLARAGSYDVVVKNALGEAISEPFVVTVYAAPKLLTAPVGAKRRVGQGHVFTVVAPAYPPPAYQWFKDGTEIPGQTFSTLALSPLELAQEGLYSVRVTNSRGVLTTKPVKLAVSLAPYGPVQGSAYRFDNVVYSNFGDALRINARFAISRGRLVVTDFADNTVSSEPLNFSRVSRDRVRFRYQETEDGVTITLTFGFVFETPKSGRLAITAYADGYGTFARGDSPFTYTEPGL